MKYSNMEETELFTVNVHQVPKRENSSQNDNSHNDESQDTNSREMKQIDEYQNMLSARVIRGRILELEHSNLAGPEVKFKTVVNYEKTLDTGSFLGISFQPQNGYISKPDEE